MDKLVKNPRSYAQDCYNNVGEVINKLRKDHGYSEDQLAEMLGYSRLHLKKMINGKKPISLDVFLLVRDHFNVSSEVLLGEPEVKLTKSDVELITIMKSLDPEQQTSLLRIARSIAYELKDLKADRA
jgi:transcriptional regulator with XRE-family HTH domain